MKKRSDIFAHLPSPDAHFQAIARPRGLRSRRGAWALVLVVLALVATFAAPGGAEEASDLRGDVPSGDAVRDRLADLASQRETLENERASLEAEVASALTRRDLLGVEARALAIDLEQLRASFKQLAVSSFVSGNTGSDLLYLLSVEGASDLSKLQEILRNVRAPLDETTGELIEKLALADGDLLALVARIEAIRARLAEIVQELDSIEAQRAEAVALLPLADAWDSAERAIAAGPWGFAPMHKWEALRFCESSDDYGAISKSGRYRGAYQFDLPTWGTVGGTGDPAEASPSEQDARARELYARRGHQPWPVCGRHLR